MSTLDDLRSTLDRHADELHDADRYVRPVAVRARIRAVRRRRAAAVSVAAALVLVGAAAAVGSLRSPSTPQPASVVGVDVPRDIEVLGFPYALSELTELTVDSTDLARSEHPRAVVLTASGLGSGVATLYSNEQPIARVRPGEQVSAPVDLDTGAADLRVRFTDTAHHARAGVAVYEATGELAQGVANATRTSVFRNEVAGDPLVAAAFAQPGDREVRLRVPGSANELRFASYCAGDDDLMVNVSIDGHGALSGSCGDRLRDAGRGSSFSFDDPVPGAEHDVRVYLTRGDGDQPVDPDGADFGVGIYQLSSLDEHALGQRIPARVEYGGRTWVLDGLREAPATIDTERGDVLLGLVATGRDVNLTWHSALDGDDDGSVTLGDGGFTSTAGLLLPGDSYDVRTTGRPEEARLVVYRPE